MQSRGDHGSPPEITLLEMLQAAPELAELCWPRERVCSGLKVCVCVRDALLRACKSKTTQLGVALRLRSPRLGKAPPIAGLAETFASLANASLYLAIRPSPDTRVPVSVFSTLYHSLRAGSCSGPVWLDLSGCYWGLGDDPCQYLPEGPQLPDTYGTVEMNDGHDEGAVFQALAYSKRLQHLTWANCMPTAEALDLRPLASSLVTSLTYLGRLLPRQTKRLPILSLPTSRRVTSSLTRCST